MGNTLENKAKFFAQYWGQTVIADVNSAGEEVIYPATGSNMYRFDESILVLKNISSMSKKDALEVCMASRQDVKWSKMNLENLIVFATHFSQWNIRGVELFRSKGYALPFISLSVETMVEYGWIKLKED